MADVPQRVVQVTRLVSIPRSEGIWPKNELRGDEMTAPESSATPGRPDSVQFDYGFVKYAAEAPRSP